MHDCISGVRSPTSCNPEASSRVWRNTVWPVNSISSKAATRSSPMTSRAWPCRGCSVHGLERQDDGDPANFGNSEMNALHDGSLVKRLERELAHMKIHEVGS